MIVIFIALHLVILLNNRVLGTGYVTQPPALEALYQTGIDVRTISGTRFYFRSMSGIGTEASYNGVMGVAFDRTEKYAFISNPDGKNIRKLNYRTTLVDSPNGITGK